MKVPEFILVVCASGLVAACSSAPKADLPSSAAARAPVQAPAARQPAPAAMAAAVAPPPLPEYLDPRNPISTERSVYFGFDDATVRKDDFALIERQAKYLASHPRLKVAVEGNTDEQGSAEYNLALGQKRAEAVVRAMKVYGAADSQMEATSWGREKPRAGGHDETAWAQNRRADVVYPAR
jgi:peptidoglycan-associated lipoprotein